MAFSLQETGEQLEYNKHAHIHSSGDPLAIIYNEGLWCINNISPMYNMRYSPVKLKMYASKMKQAIIRSVPASSAKYKVSCEELPNLKYSQDDDSGLIISVTSSLETNKKTKIAYIAVLLSWGVCEKVDKAVHLPYLLDKGEQKVGTAVKSTIQQLFDCNIIQFFFTQCQLLRFGFNFIDNDTSRSTDQFTLVYKTPQTDQKEKLSLSFDVGDISMIWNGVKDEVKNQSELVNLAYQILQNQIFYMVSLDITVFDISEVRLPKAEAKTNGCVKMKTPEIVNCVLTVLNEISNIKPKDDVTTMIE